MKIMKKGAGDKIILKAEKRVIFGKKTKKLRNKGIIPANIFGRNFKSLAISINEKEFRKNYRLIKEKPYFFIKIDDDLFPVIIHQIQNHPVTNQTLHIDFRKVDLKEKIETMVPIKIIGSSEAVEKKGGILLQQKNKLLVESLPENIPSIIEVNIEKLKEIGDEIKVKDLPSTNQYRIKEDLNAVILSITKHKEEKITPEQPSAETTSSEETTAESSSKQEMPPKETSEKSS